MYVKLNWKELSYRIIIYYFFQQKAPYSLITPLKFLEFTFNSFWRKANGTPPQSLFNHWKSLLSLIVYSLRTLLCYLCHINSREISGDRSSYCRKLNLPNIHRPLKHVFTKSNDNFHLHDSLDLIWIHISHQNIQHLWNHTFLILSFYCLFSHILSTLNTNNFELICRENILHSFDVQFLLIFTITILSTYSPSITMFFDNYTPAKQGGTNLVFHSWVQDWLQLNEIVLNCRLGSSFPSILTDQEYNSLILKNCSLDQSKFLNNSSATLQHIWQEEIFHSSIRSDLSTHGDLLGPIRIVLINTNRIVASSHKTC